VRRITAKFAKPGMVLSFPVYDNYGNSMFYPNAELEDAGIKAMLSNGVTEILIDDVITDDISVVPLVPPTTEGKLGGVLSLLIKVSKGKTGLD
jgi:hypothetical protein